MGVPPWVSIDIEPTNRCNADGYFCPRDQTPHQGLMSPETFAHALQRSIELREAAARADRTVHLSLCGLGEPLLNKHVPSFIAAARAEDFEVSLSSNAGILDERRAREVLAAGLQRIDINVGEREEEYERIYKLPWERTRDNIVRFAEMAEGQCEVQIILVDHRGDRDHIADAERYWREQGVESFFSFSLINRGGALEVDHMQFDGLPQRAQAREMLEADGRPALCAWPFMSMVVGYDGHYYLCCSDWRKQVSLGTVADTGFVDILEEKVEQALSRAALCGTCNLDPVNAVALEIRARDEGRTDGINPQWLAASLRNDAQAVAEMIDAMRPGTVDSALESIRARAPRRPSIPVRQA